MMRFFPLLVAAVLCALFSNVVASALEENSGCAVVTHVMTTTITAAPFDPEDSIIASLVLPDATLASLSTLTSYSTLTNYVTMYPSSALTAVSGGGSAYYYANVNGTTSWINGLSPPSTYHSRVTQAVQVTVYPAATSGETITILKTETVPAGPQILTSTTFGSDIAVPASTLTVTSYLTRAITTVSTLLVTAEHTESIATLPGPGISGWNASSMTANVGLLPTFSLTGRIGTIVSGPVTITRSVVAAPKPSVFNSSTIQIVTVASVSTNATNTMTDTLSQITQGPDLTTAATIVSNTSTTLASANTSDPFSAFAPNSSTTGLGSAHTSATVSSLSPTSSSTLTTIFTNTTRSMAGSMPTPSVCGEHGDFVLNWDDEPTFSPTEPITDPSEAPPVFNPYHHMYFSNGYVYIPPPRDPFPPMSEPRLVMFLTNETGPSNNPNAGDQRPGEIGAGDRASESAFWFNAYSAYLGCDNEGPDDCIMQISGYVWQQGAQQEVLAFKQNASLPACPGFQNCKLRQVGFSKSMVGLSGIQIQASVNGEQRMWYMDNLSLGWYNNTCEAGSLRIRSQ